MGDGDEVYGGFVLGGLLAEGEKGLFCDWSEGSVLVRLRRKLRERERTWTSTVSEKSYDGRFPIICWDWKTFG